MSAGLILAVDQGTSNTKALLVDPTGCAIFDVSTPLALLHPCPDCIEQDPAAIWQSVLQVIDACAGHARGLSAGIVGIAISNQRETAVAWRTGCPPIAIGNA